MIQTRITHEQILALKLALTKAKMRYRISASVVELYEIIRERKSNQVAWTDIHDFLVANGLNIKLKTLKNRFYEIEKYIRMNLLNRPISISTFYAAKREFCKIRTERRIQEYKDNKDIPLLKNNVESLEDKRIREFLEKKNTEERNKTASIVEKQHTPIPSSDYTSRGFTERKGVPARNERY